jgi:isopropylmalate/homocitrate/citramalate synthase
MGEKRLLWVSDLNHKSEVLSENHFPKRLKFYDTTLRDGEQTTGVAFSKDEKLEIARALDELKVDRIEAGMPIVSKEDKEAVELINEAGLKAEIWALCRAVRADIDLCIDIGVKHIICEIATSNYKMKAYKYTPETVLDRILDCLQYAKNHGLYTAFFAVDATRTDLHFLETIYRKAVEVGKADEVVLVDTLGVATPETMFYLTKKLREWVGVPIMTHCHNDFGMATACTLASAKGGAEYAHVTLNGLGEKTGNTDIAETAIAAKLYGIPIDIEMKKLYPTAKLIERISKIPISPLKPVVGENVFKKESGAVVAQVTSFPPAVEGYLPELIGREREILLSKKSGKKSVEYKLKELGIEAKPEQVKEILDRVKELGVRKKGILDEHEFMGIVKETLK